MRGILTHLYNRKPFHMKKAILVDIIAALFILLFTYAAVSKLIDFQKFRVQLGQSPLLTAFAGSIAWIIPSLEILISILLITERFKLLGLYASFSLMTMFSTYIILITQFSIYIPCSCGGILEHLTWNQHLLFNICFLSFALAGLFLNSNQPIFQSTKTREIVI